jgi:hypothetical protein
MTITSYPANVLPEHQSKCHTKLVLIKHKDGKYYTASATLCFDEDGKVKDHYWVYAGPASYIIEEENIISWAYIPEF